MPRGSKPGEHRGGRTKGTPNKLPWLKPSLRMIAQACEIEANEAADEFDALAAMKALARQLMSRVTSPKGARTPVTPYQMQLYEIRMAHLIPLLKEIATYQHYKKGVEPAPVPDDRYEVFSLLADLIGKYVESEHGKREIYEVIEGSLQKDVPRLVTPLRPGRFPGA